MLSIARGFMRRSPAWRNPLLVLSVCLASCWLSAQRGSMPVRTSIRGSVRDAVTHRGLERVIVMVEATDSGYAGQAETDTSGKFELQGLAASSYVVRVRFPGYEEMSQGANLTVNPNTYLSFELHPKPTNAPPAVAPEGPDAHLNARMAAVPEKARKEFAAARDLWQKGKDPQLCIDHLNKAIKFYPRFQDAYVLQGTVYIQQNSAADARSALDRAIEIDPKLRITARSLRVGQNVLGLGPVAGLRTTCPQSFSPAARNGASARPFGQHRLAQARRSGGSEGVSGISQTRSEGADGGRHTGDGKETSGRSE